MSEFQKKAAEAASRLAAEAAVSTASLSPDEAMSQSLAKDRPTMDSAIKSYLSLVSARSLAQNSLGGGTKCVMSSQHALICCRILLKAINQHTFALDQKDDESLERRVVAQLWNGLVASKQKPSRFLGRRALLWAYKDLDLAFPEEIDGDQSRLFVEEFGHLLRNENEDETENDGALLWDLDGGEKELAKRRQRRLDRAAQQQEKSRKQEATPMIEELDEEENES